MESAIFDLHASVRSQVLAALPAAREKGLELDLILERDSPRWLRGDAEEAASGISLLVRKAIEKTVQGGVSVRLESFPDSEGSAGTGTGGACARVIVRGSGSPEVLSIRGRRVSAPPRGSNPFFEDR